MIYDPVEPNSEDWLAGRRGRFSASAAGKVITPTGKLAAASNKYIAEIIGEMIEPGEGFQGNYWTARGHELEPEARAWYEFMTGNEVHQMGMILRDDRSAHVSPDGIIGEGGLLEIKCPKASTHVLWKLEGGLPKEHKAQCHAALHISEREWLDFVSYHPSAEPFIIRVEPDEYTVLMGKAIDAFNIDLDWAKSAILKEEK